MRPVEGTLLGNRYKLTSRIAVGGMGEVWKGVDSVLGREVAAKILKDEYLSESTFLARFRAEAQNMGRVSDPGIAGVYDYGDEQGSPYLVMEYVPGEALSAIIERSAPLSETDTLSIVTQAAAALGAAHKVGVIHRDIKPGNILMTPDFRVKITDFGIARVTDQAPLTKTGQVMGTAQYLAPEQATGKGSGPGSDLYALGIIAYEALAGQRPFTGDSQVAIAIAQVNQQHPPLPDTVSEPLRRFVDCLLEKKPERRPSDAFKVAKAAEALSAGDIAGAEELVPQMRHGAAASEALTQVFNNPEPAATTKTLPVTSSNDATQVYPNGAAAGIVGAGAAGAGAAAANTGQIDPNDPQNQDLEKDKPSNKGRVLIWILAIIALIAVGSLLWFFLGGGNAEPEPEPSTSAPTSEAAKTIEIDPNDYIGLTESSATQNLENQGLEVETTDINSERTAGTVADVGEGDNGYTFEEGDTVTLYISAGPAEEPQEPASDSGSDPGLGNGSETNSDSDSSSSSESDSGSDSEGSQSNSDSGSSSDSETSTDSGSEGSSETSGESDSSSSGDSADTSGSESSSGTGSGSDSTSSGNANSSDASGNSGGNNGNE
ncbi:protein kinase [Brevibacterium sp. 'Marine']|uniref:protein kinase domain-containing protein n=1 Tax=Brevibacterium sp. 'Marine' TaxID=2725563 RepID=UPI00145C3D4D|nr:protein kinase [Brevibacterium sp. 'Marine']